GEHLVRVQAELAVGVADFVRPGDRLNGEFLDGVCDDIRVPGTGAQPLGNDPHGLLAGKAHVPELGAVFGEGVGQVVGFVGAGLETGREDVQRLGGVLRQAGFDHLADGAGRLPDVLIEHLAEADDLPGDGLDVLRRRGAHAGDVGADAAQRLGDVAEAVAVGVGVQLARDLAEPLPLRPELADLAPEPGDGVLLVHRLGDALEDGAADDGPRRHPRPGLGHRAGPLAAQAAAAAGAAALHAGPDAFAGTLPGGGEPALGVAQAARRVAGELLRELLPGLAAGLPCGVGGPAERGPQRGLLAAHLLLD